MDCPLCNLQHVVMCICKYNLLVDSSLATLDCPFWYLCIFVKNIVDTALSHALWDTLYPSVIYAPTPWIHDTYKIKECWLHTPLFGAVYPLLCCITRCTYSQCMPRMHLDDLWTNMCGLLLVGVAHAFGTVGHACATKCEKCEKEGIVYVLHWKSLRMWARFRTSHNARIWSFLKTTMHFICSARPCCSLLYSSFSMWTSQSCWLHLRFIFSSVFAPSC